MPKLYIGCFPCLVNISSSHRAIAPWGVRSFGFLLRPAPGGVCISVRLSTWGGQGGGGYPLERAKRFYVSGGFKYHFLDPHFGVGSNQAQYINLWPEPDQMQQKCFCGNMSRLNIFSSSEAGPKILPPITHFFCRITFSKSK